MRLPNANQTCLRVFGIRLPRFCFGVGQVFSFKYFSVAMFSFTWWEFEVSCRSSCALGLEIVRQMGWSLYLAWFTFHTFSHYADGNTLWDVFGDLIADSSHLFFGLLSLPLGYHELKIISIESKESQTKLSAPLNWPFMTAQINSLPVFHNPELDHSMTFFNTHLIRLFLLAIRPK